jgi:hypothetical protein
VFGRERRGRCIRLVRRCYVHCVTVTIGEPLPRGERDIGLRAGSTPGDVQLLETPLRRKQSSAETRLTQSSYVTLRSPVLTGTWSKLLWSGVRSLPPVWTSSR